MHFVSIVSLSWHCCSNRGSEMSKTRMLLIICSSMIVYLVVSSVISGTPLIEFNNSSVDQALDGKSIFGIAYRSTSPSVQHVILDHPFDVRKYKLDVEPDLNTGYIDATVTIESLSEKKGLDKILLNFVGEWNIEGVTVDGVAANWQHDGEVLSVELGKSLSEGKRFSVVISYSGIPGNYPEKYSWLGNTFSVSEGKYASTMFQPYAARYFYPCFDEPSDKADDGCEVIVTIPKDLTAVSNGLLQSSEIVGDKQVFHYRHIYPIASYLICIAIGPYVTIEDDKCGVPVIHHVYPEHKSDAEVDFAQLWKMITCFSELFGPYPFEKYGMVVINDDVGWMEHQTMTTIDKGGIAGDGRYELGYVHELSHHWWGDSVTVKDNREMWLHEGFATYCEALWHEYHSQEGCEKIAYNSRIERLIYFCFKYDILDKEQGVERFPIYLEDYDVFKMFNWRTSYYKGALLLHMLRWEIGDEDFFRGMKKYYRDNAYGNVTTSDFVEAMESVSKRELEDFFHGWLHIIGYPEYGLCSYYTRSKGELKAVVTVHQAQPGKVPIAMTLPIDPDGEGPAGAQRQYILGWWHQYETSVTGRYGAPEIAVEPLLPIRKSQADYPIPIIKKIKNNTLVPGKTTKATVKGKHFTPVTRVQLSKKSITVDSVTANKSGRKLILELTVPNNMKSGPVNIKLTNPDGDVVKKKKAFQIKKAK